MSFTSGLRWFRQAAGAALAVSLAFAPARAADSISLRWNECADGGGAANRAFTCGDNITDFLLLPAFTLATAVDSVIGLEIVVDFQHSQAMLPDWWRLEPGGCRSGNLSADAEYSSLGGCADPWNGMGVAGGQGWLVGQPRGQASQARMLVAAGVPTPQVVSLAPSQPYYGARIVLHSGNTVGTPCAGCAPPACLVLNAVRLLRLSGPGIEYLEIVTPGPGSVNWATWQGGAGASCAAVPVKNRTWGFLKSLYR